ncbi:MAG: hypothetical protein R2856_13650 [Caldilineaceae bacterium]
MQETLKDATNLTEAADRLGPGRGRLLLYAFLLQRPLLGAILSEKPTVLLVDEIDRADAEFEAFLPKC